MKCVICGKPTERNRKTCSTECWNIRRSESKTEERKTRVNSWGLSGFPFSKKGKKMTEKYLNDRT